MIYDNDRPLLEAFLRAELADYRWRNDGLELIRQSILLAYWQDKIYSFEGKGDYVILSSLTNLGMTNRQLKLTMKNWDYKSGNVLVHFGTTPHDGIVIKRGNEEDYIVDVVAEVGESS